MLGRHTKMSHALLPALLWFSPARRQENVHRELVEEVIDLLELQAALCIQPAVLLLD